MTESRYEQLEDDLIRLDNCDLEMGLWSWLLRRPSPELKKAAEDIYKSIGRASAWIEHGKCTNREEMITLLGKAEKSFLRIIRHYKSLNRYTTRK